MLINAIIINLWREGITFYLDGTSWIHKGNPAFHAKIFCPRTWRKRSLGLKPTCCAKARRAKEKVGCCFFKLPARSPDLDPIENVLHLIDKKLKEDVVSRNLIKENSRQFSKRTIQTVSAFPFDVIDKTIKSMPRRIDNVIKFQEQRIKN